jgi:hypothetical protein
MAQDPAYDIKAFIPCYPSAMNEELKVNIDYVFMNDINLWNTYKNTMDFLLTLEQRSKNRKVKDAVSEIPCKPMLKIVEDEYVIGILTETNQFVQLSEPILEKEIKGKYNIPSFKNDNYIVDIKNRPMISSEIPITTSITVDSERIEYIEKIKMETNFFNVFRNTIRILINDYENLDIREKIEEVISKEYMVYTNKLNNLTLLLKELVGDKIQFIGDNNYYKVIKEVSTCIVKNKETCLASTNLCAFIEDNEYCKLIIPEKNLITQKTNELIYFGKMADEFIRYKRIKSFMLQPQIYLSFNKIGYNLKDDEIIMLQSLLTQEYFESLEEKTINKYVKFNSYDEAEPIISQTYENIVTSLTKPSRECNMVIKKKITSSKWNKCFPKNYNEIVYDSLFKCTFNCIIDIIEKKTGEKKTINTIKNEIFNEYKKYIDKYEAKIIDVLILEGKKILGDRVKNKNLTFENFIYSDNYFITTFDIWLLIKKYKIPCFFISQKTILQTKYKKDIFLAYGDINDTNDTNKFVFIMLPGLTHLKNPILKIIENNEKDIFISINDAFGKNKDCLGKIESAVDIEDFLIQFSKKTFTIKNKLIIIEDNIPNNVDDKKSIIDEIRELKNNEERMTLATTDEERMTLPKDEEIIPLPKDMGLIRLKEEEEIIPVAKKNDNTKRDKLKYNLNKTKKNKKIKLIIEKSSE